MLLVKVGCCSQHVDGDGTSPKIRALISPGGISLCQPQAFVDRYVSCTPLKRMGREEDLQGAIIYLATDMSSWVTGQNLIVDGGWSSW